MTLDLQTILGIVSLLGVFAAIIASHVRNSTRIDYFAKDNEELRHHIKNTAVHVDPIRDEMRWKDLTSRLDRIEGKLDHGGGN
jgi:hypothetical protein